MAKPITEDLEKSVTNLAELLKQRHENGGLMSFHMMVAKEMRFITSYYLGVEPEVVDTEIKALVESLT